MIQVPYWEPAIYDMTHSFEHEPEKRVLEDMQGKPADPLILRITDWEVS